MKPKLTLRYDREADILYIDNALPYAEQDSEELGDDVIARLNPQTGDIENLEVLFFWRNARTNEMIAEQVLEKLQKLPQIKQQEVLDFIDFLAARQANTTVGQKQQMAAAAQALLDDYETDTELTAFTVLDGEDFHE